MADVNPVIAEAPADDLSDFIDSTPFWVIWQASLPVGGRNRIRRISQDYPSLSRAEADAEHYRRSGVITWVEEARPLAPSAVPASAVEALRGADPGGPTVIPAKAGIHEHRP